ncbi:MAG TPA: PAS domain-containing sensor histidine kinase, partial [Anaeromyxobacter sp.]|nr:PAS domain-containing sensor histidine kinase [Anaeromyxobacter sp.]
MSRRDPRRLRARDQELRRRLEEAEQALEAIRAGQVESLVVEGPGGARIFSLEGATHAYRLLVEAMNEAAASLGLDGTILYSNARLARMLHSPLERVIGSTLANWVRRGDRPLLQALILEAQGGEGRVELRLVTVSGEEIPVLLSASGIVDDGRSVLCAVITDLREQRRHEQLVASERFARSVLEQAGDAIVVCDGEGRIVRANPAAERLCGRNPLRLRFAEAFPLALAGRRPGLVEVALGGATVSSAPASLSAGGERVDLLASAAPLHAEGEARLGCVVTLVDITDQRRNEERLQAALRRAEQGEAEKEAALEALREADRNKNHFLAMLSHELRNPLAPIRNSVFILEKAPPDGELSARARAVIERQTQHMIRLIDDLLDVTRISRGKVQLQLEPVDLREVVLRAVEDQRPAFEAGGIGLEVHLPEGRVGVHGDRTRLAQILGNLLQNVTKFTPRGGRGWVTLSCDPGLAQAVLSVKDDGAGIGSHMLPRLF